MNGCPLDAHALMRAINEPSRLGVGAVEVLRARESRLAVSTASAWELFTKHRIGKLPGAGPWLDALEGHVARLGAAAAPRVRPQRPERYRDPGPHMGGRANAWRK